MSNPSLMKQLRILNGKHAGASMDLGPGNHSLGASDDNEINITDWTFDALNVLIRSDGTATAQWADSGPKGLPLDDFIPVEFNAIIICIGPQTGSWPDLDKLRAATRPAIHGAGPKNDGGNAKLRTRVIQGSAALLLAVVAVGWMLGANSGSSAKPLPSLDSVQSGLQASVEKSLGNRVKVTAEHGTITVEGMVDNPEQARELSALLASQPSRFPLLQKVSVASEIAETIRSSVGIPNAEVFYKGQGNFSYTVRVTDVAAAQAAIERVRSDLAPVVKHIEAVLEEPSAAKPSLPPMLSSWTADGVSVIETRDGVKHMVINDGPDAAASGPSESDPMPIYPPAADAAAH